MEKREIKFRAWANGRMMEPSLNLLIESYSGNPVWQFAYDEVKPIEAIIMQYTGLKDKNGVEIYEGDWLRICAGYASKVEFQDGMFVSVYDHPEDGETLPLFDAISEETEIIGNIYAPHPLI